MTLSRNSSLLCELETEADVRLRVDDGQPVDQLLADERAERLAVEASLQGVVAPHRRQRRAAPHADPQRNGGGEPAVFDAVEGDRQIQPRRGQDQRERVWITHDRAGETQVRIVIVVRPLDVVDLDEVRNVDDLERAVGVAAHQQGAVGVRAVAGRVVEQRQGLTAAPGTHVGGPGRRVPVAELRVDDDVAGRQRTDEPDAVGLPHRRERDVVLPLPRQHGRPDLGAGIDPQADLASGHRHVADEHARLARHDEHAAALVERRSDQPVVAQRTQPHDRRRAERVDAAQRAPGATAATGDADADLPRHPLGQRCQRLSTDAGLEGHLLVIELRLGHRAQDVHLLDGRHRRPGCARG